MKLLIVLFTFLISHAISAGVPGISEELKYNYYKNIFSNSTQTLSTFPRLSGEEQKIFVDALEDSLNSGLPFSDDIANTNTSYFKLAERLRLEILKVKFKNALVINPKIAQEVAQEVEKKLPQLLVSDRFIYIIAAEEKILLAAGEFNIIQLAKKHASYQNLSGNFNKALALEKNIVSDIFYSSPASTRGVKLFMFCRKSRYFPCLMIMRDVGGVEVRNADQTLWSHPVLALSEQSLPSHLRNGNTPAGIFTIDSVMPDRDQQLSFGKFRRMMLNFIPKSRNENSLKSYLPKTSWDHDWWRANPVARDIGRSLFRIHGTGEINPDPTSTFYPFVRTSGCIANRENTYDGVEYIDQRVLLDSIMTALNLKPKYENEKRIKGILYLIDIDDTPGAVTLSDLAEFGIR